MFEPSSGEFASQVTGMVVLGPVASTVSQDTGRDAQMLADTFRVPVIGADRPGAGIYFPDIQLANMLSTPIGYRDAMHRIGDTVGRRAETEGIRTLAAVGRSAGGLGVLALGAGQSIENLKYIYAAEPVGCEVMPVKVGAKRYAEYIKKQKDILKSDTEDYLVKPNKPGLGTVDALLRLAGIGISFPLDKFHNKQIWASNAARTYATNIALYQKDVDTTISFAENSMAASSPDILQEFETITQLRAESGAPFSVERQPNTVHASFDNRDFFAKCIAPMMQRALRFC